MATKKRQLVDVVIPVFNEAGVVEQTYLRLRDVINKLPYDFQITYVDDGSDDGTDDSLRTLAASDPRISVLTFSRNFGHQAALSAGMDASKGDIVITHRKHPAHCCICHQDIAGTKPPTRIVYRQRAFIEHLKLHGRRTRKRNGYIVARMAEARLLGREEA